MEISNPRRILLVGQPDSPILDLLQDLTGTTPTPPDGSSLAGLSHSLPLKTAYYTSIIPIWIDVPPPPPPTTPESLGSGSSSVSSSYNTWATSFLDASIPGATDVLRSLGALVVVFRKPAAPRGLQDIKALLAAVARVAAGCQRLGGGAGGWDGVCLAVGLRRAVVPGLEVAEEEWEEVCRECGGFEWVDGEVKAKGRNEFKELQGIARLKEALEANDWASNDDDFGLDDFDDVEDDEGLGFGAEAAELEMEMFGMKRAIYEAGDEGEDGGGDEGPEKGNDGDGEEDEVEKLETLMLRVQAVRDMGADMPEPERKRFAAKAVKDIMKTL